jgi:hypothetical protein
VGGNSGRNNTVKDVTTGRLRHDQLWYEDGTNSGFLGDYKIRSDIGHTRNDYNFNRDPNYYDDNIMREAEKHAQMEWDMDWRLLNNNCQDYVDAVVRAYELLKRYKENKNCYH